MEDQNYNPNIKKLYRSRSNRVFGGVCGGVGEYLRVDPLIIRLAWVVFALTGVGIIAYIAALIIVPDNPSQEISGTQKKASGEGAKLWGSVLIVLGVILLLRQAGLLYYFHFWEIPWHTVLSILLIGIGAYMLFNRRNGVESSADVTEDEQAESTASDSSDKQTHSNQIKSFYRLKGEDVHMLSGVCAGLADYFELDVTLLRLLFVFATLASAGVGIVAYIAAAIIFPERRVTNRPLSGEEGGS